MATFCSSSVKWRIKGYSTAKSQPTVYLWGWSLWPFPGLLPPFPGSFGSQSQWEGALFSPRKCPSAPAHCPWPMNQRGQADQQLAALRLHIYLFHMWTFLSTLWPVSGLSLGCNQWLCHCKSFWVLGLSQMIIQCRMYVCDSFDRWRLIMPLGKRAKNSLDLQA